MKRSVRAAEYHLCMNTGFSEHVARAQAARVRVVDFQAQQHPLARFVFALLGWVVFVLVLVVLAVAVLLLIPVILIVGISAAVFFTVKRRLAAIDSPNASVAGFRTDGRANVRVINRDDETPL